MRPSLPPSGTWLRRPVRADGWVVAAYWLLVGPFLLLEYRAEFGWPRVVSGVLGTIWLDSATVALLIYWLLPRLLVPGRGGLALALVPGFVMLSGAAYLGTLMVAFGQPVRWTVLTLLYAAVAHAKSYGLLAVLLTGKRYFEAQRRVLLLQKAQAESELRALKAQLDPHFLFNNLNVLQMLIGQDAEIAGHYLGCFANLYRYLIRHRDADFVTLAEELQFLADYVYLLRHRFGAAYAFEITLAPGLDPTRLHTVPGTLQILIENALKHNSGDDDEPLPISLTISAQSLQVHNPQRPKHTRPEPGGTGLRNLRERYRLLAGQPVQIENLATEFAVTVPLLHQVPGQ